MPKTVIKQQTLMCPLGIGQLGQPGACRFHRASDNLPTDGRCPLHSLPLEIATRPEDQMTMTVMGAEDIEAEIEREDAKRVEEGRLAQTVDEKAAYRTKRQNDIALAIVEARRREAV